MGKGMIKKIKKMTDAACLEALLRREKAERVVYMESYAFPVAAIQAKKRLIDAYSDPIFAYQSQRQMATDIGWIFQPVFPSLGGEFGGEIKLPEGKYAQALTTTRYPVETEEDAWNLNAPGVIPASTIQRGMEFCRLSSQEKTENEIFNVTLCVSGPFTAVGEICGVERLCRWMVKKPEVVHRLLRVATDYLISEASLWLNTFQGASIIYFPSEPTAANNIISPAHFAEFALPYIKELHEKVIDRGYRHILCHICGNQAANLPYWAKIPMGDPGIVSIGSEVDLETAAGYFPRDIIYGNLDPVSLQMATPNEVYEAAGRVVLAGKCLGYRYTFGLGCEIPPGARKENLLALMRAVEDFGWYD
jgi:uroporphyrinogen decarboxylase